jgi:alpha-beta hydrolase superfamily lysophospholipase
MALVLRVVAIALATLMCACTSLVPYRTIEANATLDCGANSDGQVPRDCRERVLERAPSYDLMFVEFDDQGLQFPSERFGKPAAFQIESAIERLKLLAAEHKGLSVVVFVHGWNHNASSDDDNVKNFRRLLHNAALIERADSSGYRVVGLYVAWRGLSSTLGPLKYLSFWTRKSAALHVAQGSSRELFSRLRGFKCAQNAKAGLPGCNETASGARPKVQTLMIGHSFGGLVLFNAVSGALIESLTHAQDSGDPAGPSQRYGDLVVLLNPAFEATRYTPLHRIATLRKYYRYQAPLMVSITTTADQATGKAFPFGRFINGIFERVTSEEEDTANTNTIGHIPQYVSHQLTVLNAESKLVKQKGSSWKSVGDF